MILKRTILFTILFACTQLLFSQQIVDTSKIWSIMEEHCQPWGSNYSTNYFRFDNDTVIENKTYKKVWISEDEYHQEWNFYGAFIREENSKVYFREIFQEEGLIYDFNLEMGDSVVVNNTRGAEELTLFFTEIDSVEVEDGYRERWKLISNEYENTEYWIRGIGSETGVINSGTGVFGGLCGLFTLLCEKENDELVYMNPEYGSCFLITTGVENNALVKNEVSISYNPNNKTVNVSTNYNRPQTILLTDITGKIISRQQIASGSFSFNLFNNPNGLYIISVLREGRLTSEKFIHY